ncbi:MAG: RnfABCDGE type electron transport complex subunit D [bacterium]|nr:RnfABCDGE type electron transport complex subunit D [bacterium]
MLFFPRDLTRFTAPGTALPFGSAVDVVTSATPMHTMQMPAIPEQSLLDMFLGRIPGCIGEVSAIALLLGGIYLIARHVISARTPLAYIGTVALLTLVLTAAVLLGVRFGLAGYADQGLSGMVL